MGHSTIQMTFDTYGHLFPAPDDDQVGDVVATGPAHRLIRQGGWQRGFATQRPLGHTGDAAGVGLLRFRTERLILTVKGCSRSWVPTDVR
jgi:hypothetical protein